VVDAETESRGGRERHTHRVKERKEDREETSLRVLDSLTVMAR
jgi:hypothetical protein